MRKDKCASCGKQDKLKATIFHSDHTDCDYRIMVCADCDNGLGPTLKVTPTYCPACGKKLGKLDLDYEASDSEFDDDIASEMGEYDPDIWDSRFRYVYSMMECPTCGFYASHGHKWYWDDGEGGFTLLQPEGAPISPAEERRLAEAAGQLDMFAGQ